MTDYNWYCLRTLPRQEITASKALSGFGLEILTPKIRIRQVTKYRINHIVAPLFPSYLFACLDLQSHYARARKTQGVAYFVGFDGSPFVVPQAMIDEMVSRIEDGFVQLDESEPTSGYEAGQRVEITAGPYFGQEGLFRRDIDGASRVVLLLSMLGSQFECKFDLCDTQPSRLPA